MENLVVEKSRSKTRAFPFGAHDGEKSNGLFGFVSSLKLVPSELITPISVLSVFCG